MERTLMWKCRSGTRLSGAVLDGQMDLDILDVQRTDSGPYCCRVDIHGLFNDKKVIMNLRVVKGEAQRHDDVSTLLYGHVDVSIQQRHVDVSIQQRHVDVSIQQSGHLDLLRRNSTSDPDAFTSELMRAQTSFPSEYLARESPCGGVHRRAFSGGCFSEEEEPPHIIYEIRLRRPLQENVYTLD
ncbi:hypothetical protein KUCAC02_026716 [Chaenocephalus aceratus]|nr:hypothetical protein KUCAC02_026716 [Chaenocephalus aceratus]